MSASTNQPVGQRLGDFEIVRFFGQFIATVLPVLDHFNIQAAVAAGAFVPPDYLGMAFLYCVLYSSIALLIGLAMFGSAAFNAMVPLNPVRSSVSFPVPV